MLVRFVVSEAFASGAEEPDLLGVPVGGGQNQPSSSCAYKSLHYWLLVTTLYDARYYIKTDDVRPPRARVALAEEIAHTCLPEYAAGQSGARRGFF